MAELSEKQQAFIREYTKDWNGTQAAIRAGYAPRTANEQASRMLANVNIADAVAREKARLIGEAGITAERIMKELAALAFAQMPDFMEWGDDGQMRLKPSSQLSDMQAAAISQITENEKYIKALGKGEKLMSRERSIKLHDKLSAIEKLMKHMGMIVDKKEISGPGGDAVQVEVKARDYRQALGAFLPPKDEGES